MPRSRITVEQQNDNENLSNLMFMGSAFLANNECYVSFRDSSHDVSFRTLNT